MTKSDQYLLPVVGKDIEVELIFIRNSLDDIFPVLEDYTVISVLAQAANFFDNIVFQNVQSDSIGVLISKNEGTVGDDLQ